MTADELTDLEIKLLMEGVFQAYGFDFRDYSEASLRRRLVQWLSGSGYVTFSLAQSDLLRDRALFETLLRGITVNVSEMFRDPSFFKAIREQVVPHLKTYPFVRIWVAGCATGEEVYSMAILLQEEGLQGRFRIYATDINEEVIHKAQEGIYQLQSMQRFTRSYQHSGGTGSFSDYYSARYNHAILSPSLRENIVFAAHNLAVDTNFGEMNLILCPIWTLTLAAHALATSDPAWLWLGALTGLLLPFVLLLRDVLFVCFYLLVFAAFATGRFWQTLQGPPLVLACVSWAGLLSGCTLAVLAEHPRAQVSVATFFGLSAAMVSSAARFGKVVLRVA
jgi:chemotaxis protein methyltransferase CheR